MSTDDVHDEAWDRFRANVQAQLRRLAPPTEPMPVFCDHDTQCWQSSDGTAWIMCRKCASSARNHPGSLGCPVLPPVVISYTMPAAPNGTTMDVSNGGVL